MSAIIIAHFKAQEGKLAEMAEVFKASLGATRGFDGCIGLDVYVEESANTYTLIEEWPRVTRGVFILLSNCLGQPIRPFNNLVEVIAQDKSLHQFTKW